MLDPAPERSLFASVEPLGRTRASWPLGAAAPVRVGVDSRLEVVGFAVVFRLGGWPERREAGCGR